MPEQQPNLQNNKLIKQELRPNGIVTERVLIEAEDHHPAVFGYTIGAVEGELRAFLVHIDFIDQQDGREVQFVYSKMYCVPTTVTLHNCLPSDTFVQDSQRVADDIMLRFVVEFTERYNSDILPARRCQVGESKEDKRV